MKAEQILETSAKIVNGDRRDAYGHPSVNHTCTADLWSTYLNRKYGIKVSLDVRDVCWMNILQKISRDANTPKEDNLVDTIGYTLNIAIDEDEKKKQSIKILYTLPVEPAIYKAQTSAPLYR